VKHPTHQDFVQQLRATQQPRRKPLAAILESAPIASETILAKRLEAVYQRLQALRSRRALSHDRPGRTRLGDTAQPRRRCVLGSESGAD
jgi:hypothetical protein